MNPIFYSFKLSCEWYQQTTRIAEMKRNNKRVVGEQSYVNDIRICVPSFDIVHIHIGLYLIGRGFCSVKRGLSQIELYMVDLTRKLRYVKSNLKRVSLLNSFEKGIKWVRKSSNGCNGKNQEQLIEDTCLVTRLYHLPQNSTYTDPSGCFKMVHIIIITTIIISICLVWINNTDSRFIIDTPIPRSS